MESTFTTTIIDGKTYKKISIDQSRKIKFKFVLCKDYETDKFHLFINGIEFASSRKSERLSDMVNNLKILVDEVLCVKQTNILVVKYFNTRFMLLTGRHKMYIKKKGEQEIGSVHATDDAMKISMLKHICLM